MTVTIIYKRHDARGVLIRRTDDGVLIVADPSTPDWLVSIAKQAAEAYDATDHATS